MHVVVATAHVCMYPTCLNAFEPYCTNLRGLWRCCLVWALFSGSHDTYPPERCLPVFLIKPSSHTSPDSGVSVESARKPAEWQRNSYVYNEIIFTFDMTAWPKRWLPLIVTKTFLWEKPIIKSVDGCFVSDWPFLLAGCGTRLKCLQSRCGNLWSSLAHSWGSTWGCRMMNSIKFIVNLWWRRYKLYSILTILKDK